ncbi:MAG: ABC transporter permease [Anaerolineae bacterium]|nr:ABC transporter permease [Anaerolineae bacterium]
MRNFFLIAKREYLQVVAKRGFILTTVAIPIGLAILIGLGILIETMDESNLPMGYVDRAGILDAARQDPDASIAVRAFPDETAARAALENGQIQAFFVFPPDYVQTLVTELYYSGKTPGQDAWGGFDDFVRANLVASYPAEVQARLLGGPEVTVHDLTSNRKFSESSIINIILPFVAAFFFFIATMLAAGYTIGVVANEKENRTIEIMLTSVTPGQMIGGKTVGLLAATLTQLGVYVVAAVAALKIAAPYVVELQQVETPWAFLGIAALFFFPAYALVAAIMVSIGSAVGDLQQGQQLAGIVNLIFMLPILLSAVLIQNPAGPLAVALTLFPASSFLTVALRWGLGTIPAWQMAVGWALLVATTLLMFWVAARVFRAGMLHYGQPLSLRAALASVRRR